MADTVAISALPADGSALAATDIIPLVNAGTTKKITGQKVLDYVNASAQLASMNQITNLYGSAYQFFATGTAIDIQLSYPLGPRYGFMPDPGVSLNVIMPVFDATQQQTGQQIQLVNLGTNTNITPVNNSGSPIGPAFSPGQTLNAIFKSNGDINTWVTGSIAPFNSTDFIRTSGGTMTGNLILNADATLPLQAVTYEQFQSGLYGSGVLHMSSSTTLTYPLPSLITITNGTSITFPAFDLTKLKIGQSILVINGSLSGAVTPRNSGGSQFGASIPVGYSCVITIDTVSPDVISQSIYLEINTNIDNLSKATLATGFYAGNVNTGAFRTITAGSAKMSVTNGDGSSGNPAIDIVTVPALSGDITTTGSTNVTTLKNTGTAGTYPKVTTDAQGRVTAGTTLVASDIPNIAESQVTNLTTDLAARLISANNLSDLASVTTAQTNLNVPTRTGGNSSGTWGISITGNAATATSSGTCTTVPALSGDITTTGSTNVTTLKNAGISGTYTKVTTDAQGRVTAGGTLSASDIPNIAESQVTNLTTDLAARLVAANNLSDLASAATARTNLGLGTIATQNANNVNITGGTITGVSYSAKVITDSSTARTLSPTDADSLIVFTNTGTVVVSIDSDANQAVPNGSQIELFCKGGTSALVSVSPTVAFGNAAGVIYNNISTTVPDGGSIVVRKIDTNLWEIKSLYTSGVFNTTWGGPYASSVSGNIPYMRIGRQVTLQIPAISGTSVGSSYIGINTALPSYLVPLVTQNGFFSVINNGSTSDGKFTSFTSTGNLRFYVGQFSNFTASGTAGLASESLTYMI